MACKQVLSDIERKALITVTNAFLADSNNSQDEKANIFFTVSNILLHHCGKNGYQGFNWIKWMKQGGATQFFNDYPDQELITPAIQKAKSSQLYMGLEYDRFFY